MICVVGMGSEWHEHKALVSGIIFSHFFFICCGFMVLHFMNYNRHQHRHAQQYCEHCIYGLRWLFEVFTPPVELITQLDFIGNSFVCIYLWHCVSIPSPLLLDCSVFYSLCNLFHHSAWYDLCLASTKLCTLLFWNSPLRISSGARCFSIWFDFLR